jgi:hypothetical protein
MPVAIFAIAALVGLVVLAIKGKSFIAEMVIDEGEYIVPDAIQNASPADPSGDMGNIGSTNVEDWRDNGITTDPATWPSGDKIWDICRAIALAEGFNVATAAPFKLNNPGDISDGSSTFGYEQHSGSKVTHFPDAATGWTWLYDKIKNHVNGKSSVYPKSLTITQFSQKYAANWENWRNIVGQQLGVDPETITFAEYVA